VAQMDRVRTILSETLTKYARQYSRFFIPDCSWMHIRRYFRLYISIRETSDTLEAMRANIDDQYKLIELRSQEYQDIIAKYRETWQAYRVSSIS
jgi:hypothetical protein